MASNTDIPAKLPVNPDGCTHNNSLYHKKNRKQQCSELSSSNHNHHLYDHFSEHDQELGKTKSIPPNNLEDTKQLFLYPENM